MIYKSLNILFLRTNAKSENEIYTEIEKCDKEEISLYKKQYKYFRLKQHKTKPFRHLLCSIVYSYLNFNL